MSFVCGQDMIMGLQHSVRIAVTCLCLSVALACREGVTVGPPASVVVTLNEPTVTIGLCASSPCIPTEIQATAVVRDASGDHLSNSVSWSSLNPLVATVTHASSSTGTVQPVGKGTTMITATVAGTSPPISGGAVFTVRLRAIDFYLEVDKGTLPIGETMTITARAWNSGDDRLTLTGPSDCLLFLRISNTSGEVVYESKCTAPTVTEELSAGQEKVQAFSWGGTSSAGSRLPTGFYNIQAVARVTGTGFAGPPLSVRVE